MKLCYINCSGLVCFETHCIFTILFNFVFDVALWSRYVEVAAVYRWILRMKLRFWLFKTFRLITLVNFHYFMIQRLASWTEHPALLCPWPSICLSVCLSVSVCPSITYISNNSRTQRPSVPKFGLKVPHLRCDSHTSFNVKRPTVRVRGGRGHTVSAKPSGHTACFTLVLFDLRFSGSIA